MNVLAAGTEQELTRRCVDCGQFTGNFCDGIAGNCCANERLPAQDWVPGQRTPLCTSCDRIRGRCYFCRVENGLCGVCYFAGHKCSHCCKEFGFSQQVTGGLPPELDPRPPLSERNQGDRGGGRKTHKAWQANGRDRLTRGPVQFALTEIARSPEQGGMANSRDARHLYRPPAPRAANLGHWTESRECATNAQCSE